MCRAAALDKSFGIAGNIKYVVPSDFDDEIHSLLIESDGSILAGGRSQNGVGPDIVRGQVRPFLGSLPPPNLATVAQFTSKGLDKSFGVNGLFTSGSDTFVNALAVQSDGQICGG